MLGFPVADMPGGEIPHYEPLDFTPGQHSQRVTGPPRPAEEKPAELKQPAVATPSAAQFAADTSVDPELPCPPPDASYRRSKQNSNRCHHWLRDGGWQV